MKLLTALWRLARREPVAVWGALISALIGVPALAGVPAWVITVVTGVATALGVPVVRANVAPTSAPTPLAPPVVDTSVPGSAP